MKKQLRRICCACLALLMLSGLFACSRGGETDETLSEQTTLNYTYPGVVEISGVSGEVVSEEQSTADVLPDAPFSEPVLPVQGDDYVLKQESVVPNTAAAGSNTEAQPKKSVTVTIPAGSTMAEIFAILDASGVASFSSLMNTAQNFDFTYYPLISAQKNNGRAFKLEGYLHAGTYSFYENSKPEDAIGKLLRSMESSITTSMRRQIANRGYTVDEILTIASIIQKECLSTAEMTRVSSIIHNRLSQGMKLEMSSTIMYLDSSVKPYIQSDNADLINQYNDYYNTFICAGLPAGPICSPGVDAVRAALNPADTDYLYFCVDDDGKYYYASTLEEHQANLEAAGQTQPE